MSNDSLLSVNSKQNEKTVRMIMSTFNTLSLKKNGVSANEIAEYLRLKYGDVWRVGKLVTKAQDTLRRRLMLGFLERNGDRYVKIGKRRVSLRCCPRVGQRLRRRHRRRSRLPTTLRRTYHRYHSH